VLDATTASLEDLVAKLFIARGDVKARQTRDGAYMPVRIPGTSLQEKRFENMSRDDLKQHLAGTKTFGHYLVNTESKCKMFVFDIDLDKTGKLPTLPAENVLDEGDAKDWQDSFTECNPREVWRDRAHPARSYIKTVLMLAAMRIQEKIRTRLNLPTIVTYSGNKGVHVYCFTGLRAAEQARIPGILTLKALNCAPANKDEIFWKLPGQNNQILTVEVFPKQDTITGDQLGNLVRLPLGRNLKNSSDPCFIVDTSGTHAPNMMVPVQDPRAALAEVLTKLQALGKA